MYLILLICILNNLHSTAVVTAILFNKLYNGVTQPPQEMQMSIPSSFTWVSEPGGHWHCGISISMQHTRTINLISFSITKHNLLTTN